MAPLRLGTRGSALAVAQSSMVARSIESLGVEVELVTIRTSGDERAATAGAPAEASAEHAGATTPQVNDKERFVKEIEQALLAGKIDLAVHSAKDVPGALPDGLAIVGVPERADPRDALCRVGHDRDDEMDSDPLASLPQGAVIGTASLRRRAQLLALRPDLELREIRGNVDTRLRRLEEGRYDAIVLATAGLERLGIASSGRPLPLDTLTPAPGQGCLALEARTGDDATRKLASRLTDPRAFARLTAERTLVTRIGATCHTPVGAHATIENHTVIRLRSFVGSPDGADWIRDEIRGLADDPQAVGAEAADRLVTAGAAELLGAPGLGSEC